MASTLTWFSLLIDSYEKDQNQIQDSGNNYI